MVFPPPPLVRYNRGVRFSIALILLGTVACETVPITGRSQMMLVTEGDEVQMGLESYQQILGKSKVSTDARLNEQVTRVGRRIAEATDRKDYQWEFKVIEDQAGERVLPARRQGRRLHRHPAGHARRRRPRRRRSATRWRTPSRVTAASACRSSWRCRA